MHNKGFKYRVLLSSQVLKHLLRQIGTAKNVIRVLLLRKKVTIHGLQFFSFKQQAGATIN